jgi:hypothetical protein
MTNATSPIPNEAFRVRRRLDVPDLHDAADALRAQSLLSRIDGVFRVSADSEPGQVTVEYSQTRTDYRSLQDALTAAGFSPARGRWARIRRAWLTNLDETARANAAAPQAPCCSRPPTRIPTRNPH